MPGVTICFRVDTRMNCYKKINVIDGSKCTSNWTAPHLHLYSNGEVSKIEPSTKDAECFTANEDGSLLQRGTVNNMTIIIKMNGGTKSSGGMVSINVKYANPSGSLWKAYMMRLGILNTAINISDTA